MTTRVRSQFFCNHAVVTGGSSGLGLALVQSLLASGASVASLDMKLMDLSSLHQPDGRAESHLRTYSVDITVLSEVQRILDIEEAKFGEIDFLANCAGVFLETEGKLPQTPPAIFERLMRVNYMGNVNTVQTMLPRMLHRDRGRILVVASVNFCLPIPYYAAYSCTKAALKAYADALRLETLGTGVTIHVALPGAVATPMQSNVSKEMAEMTSTAPLAWRLMAGPAPADPKEVVKVWLDSMRSGLYVLRFTDFWVNLALQVNRGMFAPTFLSKFWELLLCPLAPALVLYRLFMQAVMENRFRQRNRQRTRKLKD
eukprot:jgi/Botrbrau1/13312/Bobra.0315s0010.1